MEVYVITREVSIPMDSTETNVIGVVSSESKAKRIVECLKKHSYQERCANTYYEYDKYELDNIKSFELWGNEENIIGELI